MACAITYGYQNVCRDIGGIQYIYIGTFNSGLSYTLDASAPGLTSSFNTITGFTGSTSSFFKFDGIPQTSSLVQVPVGSTDNGTAFWTQTLEMTNVGLNQALSENISVLLKGRWRVLVLDQNGNWFLIGRLNGCYVTSGTGGLGKAFGDLNGMTLTFEANDPEPIRQVSSAAAAQLGAV
jgi:hypothetical protein